VPAKHNISQYDLPLEQNDCNYFFENVRPKVLFKNRIEYRPKILMN